MAYSDGEAASVGEGEGVASDEEDDDEDSSVFLAGEAVDDASFFLVEVDDEVELLAPVFLLVDELAVPVVFFVVALEA